MEINSRADLARYFHTLRFMHGAEIGVLGGSYSITLCNAMPDMKLLCIDTWGLYESRRAEYHRRKYVEAQIRLEPYKNATIMRMASMEALAHVPDNSLDFVYIDASHKFDDIMRDIIEWSRKVNKGGIVAGHDYIASEASHVKEAVDIYVKVHKLDLFLTNPSHDRGYVSWWFVKK